MTFKNKTLILIFAAVLVSTSAHADNAKEKSVSTVSKARVLTPITLVNLESQGLDFGLINIGGSESKIVVSASEVVSPNVISGNAVVVGGVPQTAAKFEVSGGVNVAYLITLPETTTMSSGSNTLTISNYTCSKGAGGIIGTSDNIFYVGAQLLVPVHSVPGAYSGTFLVTVAYN